MTIKLKDRDIFFVYEVEPFIGDGSYVHLMPTYYDMDIVLSPYVLQRLIQWLIRNQYILTDGTVTVPVRNRKRKHNDTSKEKDTSTIDSTIHKPPTP